MVMLSLELDVTLDSELDLCIFLAVIHLPQKAEA